MPLPPGRYVDLPGRGRTWIYEVGSPDRPPVVLLHGWTSSAALNFQKCYRPLSEDFHVVAIDHRGHGRGLVSRRPFTLEDCADDVAAMIDHVIGAAAVVVGYSMGGPIAQLTWRRHPGSVAGLVLCATAARFRMGGRLSRRLSGPSGVAIHRVALGTAAALSVMPAAARAATMGLAIRNWNPSTSWAEAEWRRHNPGALIQAGLALSRFDSRPWIGDVTVPSAVLVTELDETVPKRLQEELVAAIAAARCFPVEGDHRVVVEHPDRFVPQLLSALTWAISAHPRS